MPIDRELQTLVLLTGLTGLPVVFPAIGRGWTGSLTWAFQPGPEIVSRSQYLLPRLDLWMHLVGLVPRRHSILVAHDPRVALTSRSSRHEVARRTIQQSRDSAVRCALSKAVELLGDGVYRM